MSEQQTISEGQRVVINRGFLGEGEEGVVTRTDGARLWIKFDCDCVPGADMPYSVRYVTAVSTPNNVSENPKAAFGNLKTPTLSVIPSPPLLQVGEVMRRGAEKYGAYNWRESRVNTSTYIDAAMRHLMSYQDGETLDPDDNQSHLAHAAASLFVIMDALAVGNATDDRPKPGVAAEFIATTAANRNK